MAQRPRCQQQQEREPWQPTQPTQQSQQPQQLAEEVWWHRHRRPLAATLAALAAVTPLLLGLPIDVADARAVLTAEERNTIGLFQRSRPSVVYITSLTTRWVGGRRCVWRAPAWPAGWLVSADLDGP